MVTREGAFFAALRDLVGVERLVTDFEDLITYECDGHTLETAVPLAVALPETTDEVAAAVRLCRLHEIPFVARGTGTGLSGGTLSPPGGVVIALTRMNRILEIDAPNRRARVQPGVINAHLSAAAHPYGLLYAPDPSSQGACSMGGNVAENSGGPHTLRYGVTTNHILGLEIVLADGSVMRTGSGIGDAPGYDVTGAIVGSEGTFGIVTEITVNLLPIPAAVSTLLAVYDAVDDACAAVSAVIAAGIVPAALELIDRLGIEAVESHLKVGYPLGADAVLLIELEGDPLEIEPARVEIERICRAHHARDVRLAADEEQRRLLWKGRKQALGALGKLAPAYYTLDGVVPRARVPEAIRRIGAIGRRLGLRIANVCHVGDGNMHPLILFDPKAPGEIDRVHRAGEEILGMCIALGGALSGEHGIGIEKRELMPLLFSPDDLDQMRRLRHVFDPDEQCNPGKIFPTGRPTDPAMPRQVRGWV